ncbi:hypothetical protein JCM8547_000503 [Rhodosporidiobolus lusitaniae]
MPQTAFSTYCAALLHLQTGYISFLPLSSSSSSEERTERLDKAVAENPSLPLPVSPKSVYRLAHLLSLDDLQYLALIAFEDSLSVENAAKELFSDISIAYDELRKVILRFIETNWNEVKKTATWTEQLAKIQAEEMPEAAPVLVEVLNLMAR